MNNEFSGIGGAPLIIFDISMAHIKLRMVNIPRRFCCRTHDIFTVIYGRVWKDCIMLSARRRNGHAIFRRQWHAGRLFYNY